MGQTVEPVLTAGCPLPPGVWMRPPSPSLPFPLGVRGCRLYARGRHALWQGLRAAGLGEGNDVLAPAYHHGSDIEALRRTGAACRFYEVGPALAPDEAELEALLGPRTRALHLIHYLGFPQDGERWRSWCDRHGLLLIEDAAQAWLASTPGGRPLGSYGDVAIFSLYKSFGLPDGAALIARRAPPPAAGPRRLAAGPLLLEHGVWLLGRSTLLSRAAWRRASRARRYDRRKDFALGDPDSPPSAATRLVLPRVADTAAAARRRANYERLLAGVGSERVAQGFRVLPPGASPFVFPQETGHKAELLAALRQSGIRALDLWSAPHPSLPAERFPAAAELRRRVVGLPVHQELRPADLERVIAAGRRHG
jgi:dTDP-4-amino-4,6-dideoxygalactose transaminase